MDCIIIAWHFCNNDVIHEIQKKLRKPLPACYPKKCFLTLQSLHTIADFLAMIESLKGSFENHISKVSFCNNTSIGLFWEISNTVSISATLIKLWKSSQKFLCNFWLTFEHLLNALRTENKDIRSSQNEFSLLIFGGKMILEKLKLIIWRRGWKQVVKLSFVRMLLRTS